MNLSISKIKLARWYAILFIAVFVLLGIVNEFSYRVSYQMLIFMVFSTICLVKKAGQRKLLIFGGTVAIMVLDLWGKETMIAYNWGWMTMFIGILLFLVVPAICLSGFSYYASGKRYSILMLLPALVLAWWSADAGLYAFYLVERLI